MPLFIQVEGLHQQTGKFAEQLKGRRAGEQAKPLPDGGPDQRTPPPIDRRPAIANSRQIRSAKPYLHAASVFITFRVKQIA